MRVMTANPAFDSDAATVAMRAQWNQTAKGWSDSGAVIRPWLHEATQAMLGMAGVQSGCHVLDVAAGAGDQTLDIAERVGPQGYVLATDLSPDILQLAAQRAAAAGHRNVETRVSNGEILQVEDARFDAVVCRLGLMFFGDPLQGLREMARVLKPGGGVCTIVFGAPQANHCVTTVMSMALRYAGLPLRDPYQPGGLLSLGKPGLIDELFGRGGFPRDRDDQDCGAVQAADGEGLYELYQDIGGADRADCTAPGTGEGRSSLGRYGKGSQPV
jgi:SAM-dependent methyltransferase